MGLGERVCCRAGFTVRGGMEGLVEDGFELRGGTGGALRSLHSSLTCAKEEHVSKQQENLGNSSLNQMKHIWFCLTL